MKERPILFSGPMVKAILEGRKTQTRRVVKGRWLPLVEEVMRVNGKWVFTTLDYDLTTPYGQPGDRLWVRETFAFATGPNRDEPDTPEYHSVLYRATDDIGVDLSGAWKPSIHMPRWASRITLEVTGVRVERLQEISRGDSMEEGCPFPNMANGDDPRQWFAELWDSINFDRGHGWASNPWVWVIEFRRVT